MSEWQEERRGHFLEAFPEKIHSLHSALGKLDSPAGTSQALQTLRPLLHLLMVASGSMGLHELAARAGQMESLIIPCLGRNRSLKPQDKTRLREGVNHLIHDMQQMFHEHQRLQRARHHPF